MHEKQKEKKKNLCTWWKKVINFLKLHCYLKHFPKTWPSSAAGTVFSCLIGNLGRPLRYQGGEEGGDKGPSWRHQSGSRGCAGIFARIFPTLVFEAIIHKTLLSNKTRSTLLSHYTAGSNSWPTRRGSRASLEEGACEGMAGTRPMTVIRNPRQVRSWATPRCLSSKGQLPS